MYQSLLYIRGEHMIKAIFFDIDGTLLSPVDCNFPESARQAIKLLKEKGIQVFLATGRHLLEMEELPIKDISFDGYVLLNGQLCLNANKEMICSFPINEEETQELVKLFNRKEIPVVFVEKDDLYINCINEDVKNAQDAIALPIPQIKEYNNKDIYQASAFGNEKQTEEIIRHLPNCKIMRWNDFGVDIISKQGGKSVGIKHMLDYFHLSQEEIMAFGDGENDIDMLEFAGIGIAMKNAKKIVKECADDIADTVDEDGIYKMLKKYEII